MQSLIEVFRMTEVPAATRIKIITQLGQAIDHQYGMNITKPLVDELINQLNTPNTPEAGGE